MAIIQISKLQVRSGNLVDLPQLDDAEFGWATDAKKLYIGKTTPNENIEILTSYSNIYFSQMNGSYGNLNITTPTAGQTLTYNASSNTWVNTGGAAGGLITLGDASNVKLTGGAIGYVLQTDGTGNLSWTPQGVISANISGATQANPVVVTTSSNNYFTSGVKVTITNVGGMTQLNGNSYYAKVLTSNTFSLYSDSGLTTSVNGTGYSAYTSGGRAVASIGGSGSGSGAGGSTYSIQYNSGGISTGDANFQWNYTSQALSVTGTASITGNATVGNLSTAGRIVSTIATGTAPLTVTSTTRVSNLNAATSGIANTVNDSAQPNITSVGTLTGLSVSGNANIGNIGTAGLITATGNVTAGNMITAGIVSAIGNVTGGNIVGTLHVGNLSGTGNSNIGNLGVGIVTATGNVTAPYFIGNLQGNVQGNFSGNFTVGGSNTQVLFNDSGLASASAGFTFNKTTNALFVGNTLSVVGNANVGNIGATSIVGTISTASQTNITAVGTLATLSVSGTATVGNVLSNNLTTGANTSAGTITGNWTLTSGSRLQATYADLAEYYEADFDYEPGTVLAFGGEKEVTIAEDGTTRVAGVVSTDPAYAMNAKCPGIAVAIALQGRVPTKVRGTVRKGDMMVSAGSGYARPWNNPHMGTVIGKALEDFDGIEGVIEIAVGRL